MGAEARSVVCLAREEGRDASMRPRLDGRANCLPCRLGRGEIRSASMRPRLDGRGNQARSDRRIGIVVASMRPRHDGRGNLDGIAAGATVDALLQ